MYWSKKCEFIELYSSKSQQRTRPGLLTSQQAWHPHIIFYCVLRGIPFPRRLHFSKFKGVHFFPLLWRCKHHLSAAAVNHGQIGAFDSKWRYPNRLLTSMSIFFYRRSHSICGENFSLNRLLRCNETPCSQKRAITKFQQVLILPRINGAQLVFSRGEGERGEKATKEDIRDHWIHAAISHSNHKDGANM